MSEKKHVEDRLRIAGKVYAAAERSRLRAISAGVAAGLTERRIGTLVGLSGPRINQLKKERLCCCSATIPNAGDYAPYATAGCPVHGFKPPTPERKSKPPEMTETTTEQVEHEAAAHPVWSCGDEAIKDEFRRLEAQRDKWIRWHSHAERDAEILQEVLEIIGRADETNTVPQVAEMARLAVERSGERGREFVEREGERDYDPPPVPATEKEADPGPCTCGCSYADHTLPGSICHKHAEPYDQVAEIECAGYEPDAIPAPNNTEPTQ